MSSVVAAYGESAEYCDVCGGIFCRERTLEWLQRRWLLWPSSDARTMDAADQDPSHDLDEVDGARCPSCATEMVRSAIVQRPRIVVDRCSKCGGAFFARDSIGLRGPSLAAVAPRPLRPERA